MENEPDKLQDTDDLVEDGSGDDKEDDGVWGDAVDELDKIDKENEFNPEDLEQAA